MRGLASVERRRLSVPALASLLLHTGAALALAALLGVEPLPPPPRERGVEIVWQDSQADAAPGEEAAAPPAEGAEAQPRESLAEARQDSAEEAPPPEASLPQAEAPEPTPPEPARPDTALAEAPPPPEEPSPPAEPLPMQAAETPLPSPEPAEARAAPPAEEHRPPDLPLPPPAPPPPAPTLAPAQPPPARLAPQRQQPPQLAAAASPPRPAPPGPAAPPSPVGSSLALGAVTPPGLLAGVRNPEPEYPFSSKQRGEQGTVTVRLGVSAAGEVTEVEVVATSGYAALDEAARRAVQRWRLRPAMRDGLPVAGSTRTSIHFRLQ